MRFNRKKILDFFRKSENRAALILDDKSKASSTIKDALGKAITNKGELEGVWAKMLLLFGVARLCQRRVYRNPKKIHCCNFGRLDLFSFTAGYCSRLCSIARFYRRYFCAKPGLQTSAERFGGIQSLERCSN